MSKIDKKKLWSLLGVVAIIIIYLLLTKAGIIQNGDAEEGQTMEVVADDAEEPTKAPEETAAPIVTEAPEETATPIVTEAPEETAAPVVTEAPEETEAPVVTEEPIELTDYGFRNKKLRDSHFEKHGIEMGFETVEDYILAANMVISNPKSLHKLEAEDNDHIYFLEETNEFVVLSQDGYIRTYYIANGGIEYFNRQ